MLLEHIGFFDAARQLGDAVATVYAAGKTIPVDQGGMATTVEFADAVIDALGGYQ
jgi:isocitrate/isopropylmalate dehydrogenase